MNYNSLSDLALVFQHFCILSTDLWKRRARPVAERKQRSTSSKVGTSLILKTQSQWVIHGAEIAVQGPCAGLTLPSRVRILTRCLYFYWGNFVFMEGTNDSNVSSLLVFWKFIRAINVKTEDGGILQFHPTYLSPHFMERRRFNLKSVRECCHRMNDSLLFLSCEELRVATSKEQECKHLAILIFPNLFGNRCR